MLFPRPILQFKDDVSVLNMFLFVLIELLYFRIHSNRFRMFKDFASHKFCMWMLFLLCVCIYIDFDVVQCFIFYQFLSLLSFERL